MVEKLLVERFRVFRSLGGSKGLLSFLIPAFYRLVLEVLAGVVPLGYDCVAFYVEWVMYPHPFVDGLKYFPLYNFLLVFANFMVDDAFLTVKIGSVLVSGFLGYSIYRWLKALGFKSDSLYYALLVFFFLPTLRMSWDLHRNCFGLSLALLSMAYLKEGREKMACFLAFVAGFSHPFAALSLVAMNFGSIFLKRNRITFFIAFLSCFGMLLTQLPSMFAYVYNQVSYNLSRSFYEKIIVGYVFGGWLFLPIVPFLKDVKKNFKSLVERIGFENFWWILWFLVISPLFYFSDRFIYILGIPVGTVVACSIVLGNNRKKERALFYVIMVSMAAYTSVGMFNTSIPLKYTSEVMQLFEYCQELLSDHSVVLVHRSLLGFALKAGIDQSRIIVVEPYENFEMKIDSIQNASAVFAVWWLKGKCWEGGHPFIKIFPFLASSYGIYDIPNYFEVIIAGEGFALYIYGEESEY